MAEGLLQTSKYGHGSSTSVALPWENHGKHTMTNITRWSDGVVARKESKKEIV